MMRIAIAGAGGFAYLLAQEISQTANAVLVLSRQEHPEFEQNLNVQFTVVNFASVENLRYTLQGVDLVISTISGNEQLDLIDAARRARVRLFVPSEFEGALGHRSTPNDPLDRGSAAAMDLLRRWSQSKSSPMQYTVFSCGIFYERFAPGGLGTLNIGAGSGLSNPGDYLVDIGAQTAEIVEHNAHGRPIQVCMTSVYDVARFVAAAIELGPGNWPREFKMRGDQMSVRDIVGTCSNVRGVGFDLVVHQFRDLEAQLEYQQQMGDWNRWYYFQRLIATANGRYNFRQANLNEAVNNSEHVDVRPLGFREWLEQAWGPALQ
ncbi:NAD(P)-binding protein [Pleurostoma richardsiae]|uniref:NAD(P)-binding protein n=1 Tax=Pleurostoma richardsiae TaxID=41990 RepID=A0AA38RRT6_9PEZI|nr:NAD(P)-binding protein [Pleurostoma richardsiae]